MKHSGSRLPTARTCTLSTRTSPRKYIVQGFGHISTFHTTHSPLRHQPSHAPITRTQVSVNANTSPLSNVRGSTFCLWFYTERGLLDAVVADDTVARVTGVGLVAWHVASAQVF